MADTLAAQGMLNVNAKMNASASGAEMACAMISPMLPATATPPVTAVTTAALGVAPPANRPDSTPSADSFSTSAHSHAVNVCQPMPKNCVIGSMAVPSAYSAEPSTLPVAV